MYIKIYFNNSPLFLCDEITPEIEEYMHHDDAVFIDEFSTPAVKSMLHEMRQPKVHAGIFLHSNLEELRKAFWKKFILIKAAGGAVQNEKCEILLIFRRNTWDLPKGKLDEGETIEECAVREVEEETGLSEVQLGQHIITTWHTYDEGGHQILKETWWYAMRVSGEQNPVPQTEEQISELKWVQNPLKSGILDNTYPSIRDVIVALSKA